MGLLGVKRSGLLALALLCGRIGAQVFLNFDGGEPGVPTLDENLVVEKVWQFTFDDPAEHLVQMVWVPDSTQIIAVLKTGILRLYDSIDADVNTYTEIYNFAGDVYSADDHGLLSIAFHPDYPATPSLFLLYTGEPKDVQVLPNLAAIIDRRPADFGPAGYAWGDTCPLTNEDGKVCEHPYYIDRVTVNLDAAVPTAVFDMTLMQTECGVSSTHGPGTITLAGKDLVWSQGDGSQYETNDFGNSPEAMAFTGVTHEDGCYEPDAVDPGFQGSFRAQRDDNANGKVHRIPYALLGSTVALDVMDMGVIAKGLRNPFRTYYHNLTDSLYVGDVGYGDGATSERIFRHEDVSIATTATSNFGWPCVEGVRDGNLGGTTDAGAPTGYALFDSEFEAARVQYLQQNAIDGCDAAYAAAEAYVVGVNPAYVPYAAPVGTVPDATWEAPLYEYRKGLLDPNFPNDCYCADQASITSVHIYDGPYAPASIAGKLIFADYTIGCVWYFDNDANGLPDTTVPPTVLLSRIGVINIINGNDGYLYAVDHGGVVFRMYQAGDWPAGVTGAPTLAPGTTAAPTVAFIAPAVEDGEICYPTYAIPELEWTLTDSTDGIDTYSGELTLSAANYPLYDGVNTMRTRAWNGMLPGPLIRLKPCSVYNLRVTNDLVGWPNEDGVVNTLHSPGTTNLHLHGLHVSGEDPGDNPFVGILPGDFHDYTYQIPCDHVGGTHLYHTHYHGSVALQTDSGAIGMLIVEPSAREAYDQPYEYQAMPELHLVVQEFSPSSSERWAGGVGDKLFETSATLDFILVNGCVAGFPVDVEAGQWTRLRVLRSGLGYNAILEIVPLIATDAACDVALLSKDGIPLANLPRMLPAGNLMFMSLSSRIDIAVRCPLAGSSHTFQGRTTNDGNEVRNPIVTLNVLASERAAAPDLPPYTPCRPYYLTDLSTLPVGLSEAIEIRQDFNGVTFQGEEDPFRTIPINEVVQWLVTNDDQHPLHIHINHMQLGELTEGNQWDDVPGWMVQGDWLDTLSVPEAVMIYIRPVDFNGTMLMHCHIAEHSDMGVMALNTISGAGFDVDMPVVTDYGNCTAKVPGSEPYNAVPAAIPGTILAVEFDLGGEAIAYHNLNIATNAGNTMRVDEAPEIRGDGVTNYLSYNRQGEWYKYTVDVAAAGAYTLTMTASQDAADTGDAYWSIWVGVDSCQPLTNTVDLLAQSSAATPATRTVTGTGYDTYMVGNGGVTFAAAGETTLLLCFYNTPTGYFAPVNLIFA